MRDIKRFSYPWAVKLTPMIMTSKKLSLMARITCFWISKTIRSNDVLTPGKVREDFKRLEKVPKHLAVLYWRKHEETKISNNEKMIKFNEISQLCCWALCAGIRVLSLYEAKDHLKSNADLLQSHIEIATRQFFANDKIIPTTRVSALDSNLQVNLVSREDGRDRIVKMTKSLVYDTLKGKIKSDKIDVEEVDSRLSVPQFPEPQLLITFAPEIVLDGFPPWHIRLTEIL
ncbi:3189_t:CDS:2 [Ambispora leptoticha]|uniref:ditrans,polycis-polyprenyl diphosphate synthase [(2E,6E)-farnesyldiphosphate specific] n=1 Tax=Ambispora leptoticha TaxID=144679 RepID=A0A9N8YYV6_9GLOM|nr:3189_t:CDS:2 [Ambispora leptoticha]